MNTSSSTVAQTPVQAQGVADSIPFTRQMYWLVRRELWEYRSLYVAPLAVAGLSLLGSLVTVFRLPGKLSAAPSAKALHDLVVAHYDMVALFIMGATFIVGMFYSIDALHGERRDRSILFWKSLPVSDLATVLSKAFIPIVMLPWITFVITVITHFLMMLVSVLVLLASGVSLTTYWSHLSLSRLWMDLFFHLMAGHALWYAPIFCWFLLVSVWARRVPFLWAVLPIFVIGGLEKIAFNTTHFLGMIGNRLGGGTDSNAQGMSNMEGMMHIDLVHFVAKPGLWLGLAFAAACLVAAVRLRRNRGPL